MTLPDVWWPSALKAAPAAKKDAGKAKRAKVQRIACPELSAADKAALASVTSAAGALGGQGRHARASCRRTSMRWSWTRRPRWRRPSACSPSMSDAAACGAKRKAKG